MNHQTGQIMTGSPARRNSPSTIAMAVVVLLTALLVLAGCSEDRLVTSSGELKVSEESLPEAVAYTDDTESTDQHNPHAHHGQSSDGQPLQTKPADTGQDNAGVPAISSALAQRAQGTPVLRVIEPANGAIVTSPMVVRVEVDNFELAAEGASSDGSGHLHVVLDKPCVATGEVIHDGHQHIANGASEFELELEPGDHELCLQIGDGFHSALNITSVIEVTVIEG